MEHVTQYNAIALEVFQRVTNGTGAGVVNDLHGVSFYKQKPVNTCGLHIYPVFIWLS